MRRLKFPACVALVLIAGLLLLAGPVTAQATKTDFEGTITGGIVDPGTWSYPGGNIHIRGMTEVYTVEATDPRLDEGVYTIVVNGDLGPDLVGPIHFTLHLEVEGQGCWEGTGTGNLSLDEGSLFVSAGAIGHGSGALEGLKVFYAVTGLLSETSDPNVLTMSGYILDPHGE
jgi:hypothetical protein